MANLEGAAITREQFLLREMQVACGLREEGLSNEEIITKIKAENLIQYPTERMVGNIARVCCKRMDAVGSDAITRIIATGMPEAAAQANLYAMMCTYPLVHNFMTKLVAKKYRELDFVLGPMEMNAYMTSLQVEYENLAAVTDSTIGKIKQVLRKCPIECGMLASARSEELRPVFLDFDLREAIEARGDIEALGAFGCQGVV